MGYICRYLNCYTSKVLLAWYVLYLYQPMFDFMFWLLFTCYIKFFCDSSFPRFEFLVFFFCGFFFSLKTKKTKLILHLFYCHILIRDKHYNLNKEGSCSNRFICKIYPSFFSSVFSYHLRFVQQFRENRQSLVKTKSSTCRKPHAPHKWLSQQ